MARSVAFIGRPDCLELQIDNHASFDKVLSDITEKLQAGGSQFFVGAASVNVLGHFTSQQKETLATLLHEGYGFSNVIFEGEPHSTAPKNTQSSRAKSEEVRTNLSSGASFVRLNDVKRERGETPKNVTSLTNKQRDITEWGVLTQEPASVDSSVRAIKEGRCMTVFETVRSGQSVSYDGDIIVLGDVNMGAELIATGSIVVVGVLRGVAHAGCSGDPLATVTANSLEPQQLRISEYVALAPEKEKGAKMRLFPEQALIADDRIVTRQLGNRSQNR